MTKAAQNIVTLFVLLLPAIILIDVILHFGGDLPALPALSFQVRSSADPSFEERIKTLFEPLSIHPESMHESSSPFFTRYFEPPLTPPKEQSQKHQITFQGLYESSSSEQKAFLMIDGEFHSLSVGEGVVAGFVLLALDAKSIEIGKSESNKTRIGFRETTTIESH